MLQSSQIADLLPNIVSPHPKTYELEIISKNASKNMKNPNKRIAALRAAIRLLGLSII
jgi:hypothetical protein